MTAHKAKMAASTTAIRANISVGACISKYCDENNGAGTILESVDHVISYVAVPCTSPQTCSVRDEIRSLPRSSIVQERTVHYATCWR